MKVSIIGGAGRVGSNAAYALQLGGMVREIALIDVAVDAARGEALDLRHGASLVASQKIYSGGMDAVDGSDVVVVTAGLRRKPDESRLDLISRNVTLFGGILDDLKNVKLPAGAAIIVVSNPVDILTQLAVHAEILPPERVIGLGTLLDTARLRSFLGEHFGIDPMQVDALVLGEHGDSMVPIWSSANINGVPLASLPGYNREDVQRVFELTRQSGSELIRLKGGAGYAVALAVRELVHAILLDKRETVPISTLQTGTLGIRDVCLSLPTVVGSSGVIGVVEPAVSEDEKSALRTSAEVLKGIIAGLG